MRLHVVELPGLPPLAWAAVLSPDGTVEVRCGGAVERDERGIVAGAWGGPFGDRDADQSPSLVGTALRLDGGALRCAAGMAGPTPLHLLRKDNRLVVSNSLPFALAVGGDELLPGYGFYPHDLYLGVPGHELHELPVRTAAGALTFYYRSIRIADDLSIEPTAPERGPAFTDYASYRALLREQTSAIFANAADSRRRVRFTPIASLSRGYDSPAAAVIARELGCTEAITFRQDTARQDDSGEAIARALGMKVRAFDTMAYRQREDLPEPEFVAANFAGGQIYLAGTEQELHRRIVVTGFAGDIVWSPHYGLKDPAPASLYMGGYSGIDFSLRAPALELALPALGALRAEALGGLSRSPEMAPWSVGGDYDRPIPRRLVEEAGITRGSFAEHKRLITPTHDGMARKVPPPDAYLSPHSLRDFEEWFARRRPIRGASAALQRLSAETAGRLIWSNKTIRTFRRLGIAWPPLRGLARHLRVPLRKNGFLFQWAMERQREFYRAALDGETSSAPVVAEAQQKDPTH